VGAVVLGGWVKGGDKGGVHQRMHLPGQHRHHTKRCTLLLVEFSEGGGRRLCLAHFLQWSH
jgi:hypothetical protein